MKTAKTLIRFLIIGTLGIYIGKWIWLFYDYSTHPDLYAIFSAPWYTEMIPFSFFAGIIIIIEIIAYVLIRKRAK